MTSRSSYRWFALLFLLSALLAPAAAEAAQTKEFFIYHPKHRLGEDLIVPLQAALGDNVSVKADPRTGAVVLVGDKAAVAKGQQLLEQLDQPLKNVEVLTKRIRRSTLDASKLDVEWELGMHAGGLRVGQPLQADLRARLAWSDQLDQVQGEREERLVLQEGVRGMVETGTERVVSADPDAPVRSTRYGMYILPHLLDEGKRVQLELTSVSMHWEGEKVVEDLGAQTTVTLQPGESVLVAGVTQNEKGEGDSGKRSADSEMLLWVGVSVVTY